jgi:hypothetical protein
MKMKRSTKWFMLGVLLVTLLAWSTPAPAAPVKVEVLSPVGIADIKPVKPADRLNTLEGKKIGLIWNAKPGGQYLLDEVEKQLSSKYKGITFVRMQSEQGMSAEEMIAVLKGAPKVDAVVHSVGD